METSGPSGKDILLYNNYNFDNTLAKALLPDGYNKPTLFTRGFHRYDEHASNLDELALYLNEKVFHAALIWPIWSAEKEFLRTWPDMWDAALTKNFEEPAFAAQAIAKHMVEHDVHGRIIFISSVTALKPYEKLSAYGTVLAALHTVAKMAAVDLAPHGITVNVIALGWLEDAWLTESISEESVPAHIPVGRLGHWEEIAALCRFLMSDTAAYITGAVIPLDGGYSITKATG